MLFSHSASITYLNWSLVLPFSLISSLELGHISSWIRSCLFGAVSPSLGLRGLMLSQYSPGRGFRPWHLSAWLEPIKPNCFEAALGSSRLKSLRKERMVELPSHLSYALFKLNQLWFTVPISTDKEAFGISGDNRQSPKGMPPAFRRDDRWETCLIRSILREETFPLSSLYGTY